MCAASHRAVSASTSGRAARRSTASAQMVVAACCADRRGTHSSSRTCSAAKASPPTISARSAHGVGREKRREGRFVVTQAAMLRSEEGRAFRAGVLAHVAKAIQRKGGLRRGGRLAVRLYRS